MQCFGRNTRNPDTQDEALLKSWQAPAVVGDIAIDAQALKTVLSENAEVSSIDNSSRLRWSEREHALPMPIDWKDEVTELAVRSSDLLDALDQESFASRVSLPETTR